MGRIKTMISVLKRFIGAAPIANLLELGRRKSSIGCHGTSTLTER
jgi:hypothetical protein